jgi:hypothetical protein
LLKLEPTSADANSANRTVPSLGFKIHVAIFLRAC